MIRFEYSKTYEFEDPAGRRKHYFFVLKDRRQDNMTLRLNDKDNEDDIECTLGFDKGVETASFTYGGKKFDLRADRCHGRGFSSDIHSNLLRRESILKDAHLHTMLNWDEVKSSKTCGCGSCERIFPASEVEEWIDDECTAMCPYCGTDAVLASASGIKPTPELLRDFRTYWF